MKNLRFKIKAGLILTAFLFFTACFLEEKDTTYLVRFKANGVQKEYLSHIPFINDGTCYYMYYDGDDMDTYLSVNLPLTIAQGQVYNKSTANFAIGYSETNTSHYINSTDTMTLEVTSLSGGNFSAKFAGSFDDKKMLITEGTMEGALE